MMKLLRIAAYTVIVSLILGGVLSVKAQQRKIQPVPTYTVEIRGAATAVTFAGSYQTPAGETVPVEWVNASMPIILYVNADCHLKLKISGNERFTATLFYEYQDATEWLATGTGTGEIPVRLDVPPRKAPANAESAFVKLCHGVRWTGRTAIGVALWLALEGETNERTW